MLVMLVAMPIKIQNCAPVPVNSKHDYNRKASICRLLIWLSKLLNAESLFCKGVFGSWVLEKKGRENNFFISNKYCFIV